jgi:T5orf172 domain-containing protein
MTERTLCAFTKPSGKDCDGPVPADAPVAACLKHLTTAYLYVRDLIAERDGEIVQYGDTRFDLDPRKRPDTRVVYYLRFGDRIKIGTTKDVWERIGSIPHDRLLATEPGSYDLEDERHAQFKAFRLDVNREWFRDCPEIRHHVNELRRQYGDPVARRYERNAVLAPTLEIDNPPWER